MAGIIPDNVVLDGAITGGRSKTWTPIWYPLISRLAAAEQFPTNVKKKLGEQRGLAEVSAVDDLFYSNQRGSSRGEE